MQIFWSMFLLFLLQQTLYVALHAGLHSSYVYLHDYGLLGVLFRRDQDLELYSIIWPISDGWGSC